MTDAKCVARVTNVFTSEQSVGAYFRFPDAEAYRRFHRLLEHAQVKGYSVEVCLVHYDGAPDAVSGRAARKAKKPTQGTLVEE